MSKIYQEAFERALEYAISVTGVEALKKTSVFATNECARRSDEKFSLKQAA